MISNSQNRWIALELLEEHEYLVDIVILVQLRWKNSFLECPCSQQLPGLILLGFIKKSLYILR